MKANPVPESDNKMRKVDKAGDAFIPADIKVFCEIKRKRSSISFRYNSFTRGSQLPRKIIILQRALLKPKQLYSDNTRAKHP